MSRQDPTLTRALCASLVVAAISCGGGGDPAPSDSAPEAEAGAELGQGDARNLILVSIDTLRADHLSTYGYDRPTSPRLDEFAAKGAVFELAYATSPWTIPSHASMLTGLWVASHGVDLWGKELPAEVPTLAELLSAEGYRTAGFVNIHLLDGHFRRGFEVYEIHEPMHRPRGAIEALLTRALPWVEENHEGPFFLFLHVYDVHSDYAPGPRFRAAMDRGFGEESRASGLTDDLKAYRESKHEDPWGETERAHLTDLYDAEIRQLDELMTPLFQYVENRGLLEDTLVVITSDHGEELLEHGDLLHARTLYDELVHVPLLMVGAGVPPGIRVPELVSIVDIVPTALSMLGLDVPGGVEGVDLSPALSAPISWSIDRPIFAETSHWNQQEPGNVRRAIRRGRFKLHHDRASGSRTLFDMELDPGESRDMGATEAVLLEAMWAELEAFAAGRRDIEPSADLTDEEIEKLRSLGYL